MYALAYALHIDLWHASASGQNRSNATAN